VLAHFGLDRTPVTADLTAFGGLGHSYAAQRRFVDAVDLS